MIPQFSKALGNPPEPITALTPAAWYRYGIGLTDDGGGLCSKWADQSGNGRDLTAATTARPTIQADNSLLFDGVANVMKAAGFTFSQPETIYFLGKANTWTVGNSYFDGNSANTGRVRQLTSTPQIAASSDNIKFSSNLSPTLNVYSILITIFNGASGVFQLNNQTPVTGDFGAGNMGGFYLGSTGGGVANFANIQVKEAILFASAHDAATRTTVITYLATVGGLNI